MFATVIEKLITSYAPVESWTLRSTQFSPTSSFPGVPFNIEPSSTSHNGPFTKAQVKVSEANPHGAWVDTDDLKDGRNKKGTEIKNDLHYSVDGYKILGERFAEKAIALINK